MLCALSFYGVSCNLRWFFNCLRSISFWTNAPNSFSDLKKDIYFLGRDCLTELHTVFLSDVEQ